MCEIEPNIGSHNLKCKASRRLSNFHAPACSGKCAESKMQRGGLRLRSRQKYTVSSWQTTRSSFYTLFSPFFFPRASIYTESASARKCIRRCSSASARCHAKCNVHAMQKRAAAVTLFASTRTSIPPDKRINRITSTGERISASEMGCARVRIRFPYCDIKYAVARKWILVFVHLPFPAAYQIQIARENCLLQSQIGTIASCII